MIVFIRLSFQTKRTTDKEIITLAFKEERVVITKDSDFLESFLIKNQPEKLVLIKTGNIEMNERNRQYTINQVRKTC